jgi:hypothetical protein
MPSSLHTAAQRFEHALVVGGTGMLSDATHFLCQRSKQMTLLARNAKAAAPALGVLPEDACPADWRDEAAFSSALRPRIAAVPPDLALLWVHESGRSSLLWLLQQLAMRAILVVHVLGNSSGDPRGGDEEINAIVDKTGSIHYVTVVLGSKAVYNHRRRWLTNEEISDGAIEAIQTGRDVVVGEIVLSA